MSTEKINERFHRESIEGVDSVLERMVRSMGLDPGFGYPEALDVSRETIKTWRRRGEVPLKFLDGFSKEYRVSLDYLRFGGRVQHEPSGTSVVGITEEVVRQSVLEAIDLLSLDKKVDAQQLAAAIVKLCIKNAPAPVPTQSMYSQVVHGNAGQVSQHGDIHIEAPKGTGGRK